MKMETAQEVLACLPTDKTTFAYCKDRYAAFILSQVIGKQQTIAELKKSAYSGLLDKPLIKTIVAQSGDGVLRQEQLKMAWGENTEPFLLSLAIWGRNQRRWDQVSRRGHNLVLQLNFSNKHDAIFKQLAEPDDDHDFNKWGHPVMKRENSGMFRETLAWTRIDFDFATNEALIEELQCDWLKSAQELLQLVKSGKKYFYNFGTNAKPEKLKLYLEKVLNNYGTIWDEALLTATLQFIRQELGINKIYLHTPETGAAVKRIKHSYPPRSLYSNLPKKFCFKQTTQAPEFLYRDKEFRKLEKKLGGTQWNIINLGEQYAHHQPTATEKSGGDVTFAA